jgi:hypothetical protein
MSLQIRQRSATLQNFTGGLNNYWDQSAIQDNELAGLVNFEVTTTGALASRPPFWVEQNSSNAPIYTPVASEPVDIIGRYIRADGVRFLVAVTDTKTWAYNVEAKTWTQIATFRATDSTQFQNKIVLASATAGQGGYWEAGTFTNTPTMPALGGIELFQNRFFGFGIQGTNTANTVYWSDITTAGIEGESNSVWNWQDEQGYYYVEIGSGDGQWITAIDQGYNDIVIFRNKSTYRYSYGELPEEGTMQAMQQDIGAENKRCVAKFENAHFVLSGTTLYKYQNWLYYPLNAERLRMERDPEFEPRFERAVSIVGRRCYIWHGGKSYSYNLDTATWSEVQSAARIGYFYELPRQAEDDKEELYFGISGDSDIVGAGLTDYALWRTRDKIVANAPQSEQMTCYLKTKIYDFATPVEWKRLYFWTVDLAAAGEAQAIVNPVAIPAQIPQATWDDISKDAEIDVVFKTWDELSKDDGGDVEHGTWDALTAPSSAVATIWDLPSSSAITRAELKLNNTLRFRRIYFELYLSCDGTTLTSPAQVFSIIPMIGVKAKVSQGVN